MMAVPWWLKKKDERQKMPPSVVDYTAFSAVSKRLLLLLQDNLVPRLLQSRDNIGLCSPQDHSDIVLGVYLYDIHENGDARVNGFQMEDQQYLRYPPLYLELYYVITAYLTVDTRYRFEEEQRLLGGVMQLLHDNPSLESGTEGEDLHLELNHLDIKEKMELWSGFGIPYRLALYYKASPVRMDSNIYKKVTRVTEFRTGLSETDLSDRGVR